jgi:hypothetical protein
MKWYLVFSYALILNCAPVVAQQEQNRSTAIPQIVDSLYREDQFYIGLSFNLLNNAPQSFSQNGFSGGLHLGFIRDMPFNKRRNKAIGVGLGWSTNTYNSNLVVSENLDGVTQFNLSNSTNQVDSNRFNTNLIEMPIQYRWRTSTPTEFNFWRVYTGIKISYLYGFKSSFDREGQNFTLNDPQNLNRWRYAATLTIGNGSFNAFVQYSLNPLFSSGASIDGSDVGLRPIKFGIEFYIL